LKQYYALVMEQIEKILTPKNVVTSFWRIKKTHTSDFDAFKILKKILAQILAYDPSFSYL
jgi:hypothetical protein